MNVGMIATLTASPRTSSLRSVRRAVTRMASRVSAVVAEFRPSVAQQATQPAAEPTDLFTEEDMPAAEDIAEAAAMFFRAADEARTADRAKRKARKLLDRLQGGVYGSWEVSREPSGRQTVDLEQVRRIFKEHGLGPVPMRTSADSLKVRRVELDLHPETVEAELSTLAGAR